jgi:hypothetical protein
MWAFKLNDQHEETCSLATKNYLYDLRRNGNMSSFLENFTKYQHNLQKIYPPIGEVFPPMKRHVLYAKGYGGEGW